MDDGKFCIPKASSYQQNDLWLGRLPITLIEMIVHGQGDEKYAQYSNDTTRNHDFSKVST
jgi:hypothetical protein